MSRSRLTRSARSSASRGLPWSVACWPCAPRLRRTICSMSHSLSRPARWCLSLSSKRGASSLLTVWTTLSMVVKTAPVRLFDLGLSSFHDALRAPCVPGSPSHRREGRGEHQQRQQGRGGDGEGARPVKEYELPDHPSLLAALLEAGVARDLQRHRHEKPDEAARDVRKRHPQRHRLGPEEDQRDGQEEAGEPG